MAWVAKCERCLSPIYTDDVYKTVAIPKDPSMLTLIYKCDMCDFRGAFLCDIGVWESIKAREDDEDAYRRLAYKMIEIEVEHGVYTVADLEAYWAAARSAPPREGGRGCGCSECLKDWRVFDAW